jgi:threonine dehydrogenase-like Zn-dependent dehydrogenase
VDINPYRLQMAASHGAAAVFNNLQVDSVAKIVEHSQGLGAACAFEAAGLNVTLVQALNCVRKGGQVVLVGLYEKPEISLPANLFVQREITLTGSQGYCWDFQTSLALAGQGRLDLDWMVTQVFSLEQVQQAFEALVDPQGQVVKVMIKIREGW